MYGRTALISNLITKARDRVRGFYSLKKSNATKDDVDWLLSESRFMYGGIDLQVFVYNVFEATCQLIILIMMFRVESTIPSNLLARSLLSK